MTNEKQRTEAIKHIQLSKSKTNNVIQMQKKKKKKRTEHYSLGPISNFIQDKIINKMNSIA